MRRSVTALLFTIAILGIGAAVTSLKEQPSSTTPVMQIIPNPEGESIIIGQPDSATPVMQIIPLSEGKTIIIGRDG